MGTASPKSSVAAGAGVPLNGILNKSGLGKS